MVERRREHGRPEADPRRSLQQPGAEQQRRDERAAARLVELGHEDGVEARLLRDRDLLAELLPEHVEPGVLRLDGQDHAEAHRVTPLSSGSGREPRRPPRSSRAAPRRPRARAAVTTMIGEVDPGGVQVAGAAHGRLGAERREPVDGLVGDERERARAVARPPRRLDLVEVRDRPRERVAVGRDARVLQHVAAHPLARDVERPAPRRRRTRRSRAARPGRGPRGARPRGAARRPRPPPRAGTTSGTRRRRARRRAGSSRGRIAASTIGMRGPGGSVSRKPLERTCSPSSVEPLAVERLRAARAGPRARRRAAARRCGRASARRPSGSRRRRPRSRGRGRARRALWKPIARSGAERVASGTTPVPSVTRSVADGDRGEQREGVRAGDLARDDGLVAVALGRLGEPDELARAGAPPRPGSRRRAASAVPRKTGGRFSTKAATPSTWSSVVKRSAVISMLSASPSSVSRLTNCLPSRIASGGWAAIRSATATASSSRSSCGTTFWTSPISSALAGVDHVRGEREPARPVAADHGRAADDAVARDQPDRRLLEGERARARTRRRGRRRASARCRRRTRCRSPPRSRAARPARPRGTRRRRAGGGAARRSSRASSANDAMSPPAENASPAPVSTTRPHRLVRVEHVEHLAAARGRTSGTSRSASRGGRS